MSKNLMSTDPGGEQTQYEGTHTFIQPHAKQAGQLAGDSDTTRLAPSHPPSSNAPNTHGITPADKIRYGQSIQEGGAGGKTNAGGEARVGGGFGGTEADEGEEKSAAAKRREAGYGGGRDMDRNIGA